METRLPSKFVHMAFATIVSLLTGAAGAQAQSWNITGNILPDPANNFLGTTDGKPLIIQPGGGNVGIGTKNPAEKLSVNGNVMFGNTVILRKLDLWGLIALAYGYSLMTLSLVFG
jgi:hypothetical protein